MVDQAFISGSIGLKYQEAFTPEHHQSTTASNSYECCFVNECSLHSQYTESESCERDSVRRRER